MISPIKGFILTLQLKSQIKTEEDEDEVNLKSHRNT